MRFRLRLHWRCCRSKFRLILVQGRASQTFDQTIFLEITTMASQPPPAQTSPPPPPSATTSPQPPPPPTTPPTSWQLIFQGAEARVYKAKDALHQDCAIKERLSKPYRHADLDAKINKSRLKSEVKSMMKASKLGVSVPRLDFVDKDHRRIVMEWVPGRTLKAVVDDP